MRTADHPSPALSVIGFLLASLALAAWCPARADEVTTAFTYQGMLSGTSGPASGRYDLRFTLFDAVEQGRAVAPVIETNALPVTNGLFTLALDFGAVFEGQARWLDIATNGNTLTLSPRV